MAQVDWIRAARLVLTSRELDQIEEQQLAPKGKVKYQFSAGGHELAQVLLALALDHPRDAAAVYYRSRPFLLASGLTAAEALAAGMARSNSPSQGRDVGVVFNLPQRDGPTVLPASGDVGAQYTPAAGWAQAIRYRQEVLQEGEWQGAAAAALGGDGSVAANGFWGALNMAATLRLPMLFFIEDNSYGISVPGHYQTPGGNIASNLAAYQNLKVLDGDGTDPAGTWELISTAVQHVRQEGPCLLRVQVPRLKGHTFIDDQAYKSAEVRAAEQARDPLPRLKEFLLIQGCTENDWAELKSQAQAAVAEGLSTAETWPEPAPEEAERHLFFEGAAPRQGGLRAEGIDPAENCGATASRGASGGARVNFIDAVRRTLETEMERNPRILVFGEDVGVKGGVHGATLDMQAHFGEQRVFDTSLSEEAIIGRAAGLALAGLLPVPEIQFRKYADPATEQINDLGTLRWRTANRFAAPVVVRIPVGFGKMTGDPWHSVTAEAIYAHTLGWRIAFPSNAEDAAGLLRSALRGDDPTFFFEHRALLDTGEGRRPYPGDSFCIPFGAAARRMEGNELTLVTWGAMVPRCLAAAEAYAGRVEILDLRTIIPWDREQVLASVRKTGKLLIVHEDTRTGGFAGEITAVVVEAAFTDLDAPIRRLATPDIPIPFNLRSMEAVIPSAARIRQSIAGLLEY